MGHEKRPAPGSATTAPKKRKVDNGPKYYAVRAGFKPGVYENYSDCQAQTAGFKGAVCTFFLSTFFGYYELCDRDANCCGLL